MSYQLLIVLTALVLHTWSQPCAIEPDSYCFHESCGAPLYDEHIGLPCTCGPQNIGEKFTDCGPGNTREIIYFWRPPATCVNGTLPQPVFGIPCDTVCDVGTYLDVESPTKSCKPCQPGTVSYGTGHVFSDWTHWPGQISTFCVVGNSPDDSACSAWVLEGDSINSGNNWNVNYMESVLQLQVELVRNGNISFQYQVSAEESYDGLRFIVDNKMYFFRSNTPSGEFVTFQMNLAKGYHTILWEYYKDYSLSKYQDRATIRSIEVTGTTFAYTQCQECPRGEFYPDSHGKECLPCPAGTYGDEPAASECKPCPAGQFSFPGSTQCRIQQNCSSLDESFYTYYYTPCVDGTRKKIYTWIHPLSCEGADSVALPANTTEACELPPCHPGQARNAQGECQVCSASSSSPGGDTTLCHTCEAGTAAQPKLLYFEDWTSWPTGVGYSFKSNCTGKNCYTPGWRQAHWFIDSGVGHGVDALPFVDLTISAYDGAKISFNYSLNCYAPNELAVLVNEEILLELPCTDSCVDTFKTASVDLHTDSKSASSFKVRWAYKKASSDSHQCDRVMISSIVVEGAIDGEAGAASCSDCAPGSYSHAAASLCTLCQPGYSSAGGASQCSQCSTGTFSDEAGATCLSCGNNTVSNMDKTSCTFNCSAVTFNRPDNSTATYNLSSLEQWNFTYKYVAQNATRFEDFKFSGNVCAWKSDCLVEGELIHTYVCYDNDTEGNVGLGKVANIDEIGKGAGVRFTYTHSHSDGRSCDTTLDIVCIPPTDGSFLPLSKQAPTVRDGFDVTEVDTNCHLELIWEVPEGCPLCTESDISYYETDCADGMKQRTYLFSSYCFGGIALPPPEMVECPATSSGVKGGVVAILVVAALLILAAAGAGLVYLWYQNRKLYKDYARLKESNIPMDGEGNFSIAED